ncbi:MAG TPA: hypothetical protein DCP11_07200 [Microbacteriaceae bacterium]|nr:hypothetical protein [Microbacteriaceae bacterium]
MKEEKGVDEHREGRGFIHFIDWLNHKLVGVIGPPPLGPYDEVLKKVGDAVCPVCGKPMAEHVIDHSSPNTLLNCPAPHQPEVSHNEPINEFGMPKREH